MGCHRCQAVDVELYMLTTGAVVCRPCLTEYLVWRSIAVPTMLSLCNFIRWYYDFNLQGWQRGHIPAKPKMGAQSRPPWCSGGRTMEYTLVNPAQQWGDAVCRTCGRTASILPNTTLAPHHSTVPTPGRPGWAACR